jgi:hypothetical protein
MPEPMTIVKVRPGPVLHVFRDGAETVRVPLTFSTAMALLHELAGALRWYE